MFYGLLVSFFLFNVILVVFINCVAVIFFHLHIYFLAYPVEVLHTNILFFLIRFGDNLLVVANSEAIKKIDNEIEKMQDASLKADLEKEDKKLENKKKKCRYSNSGHCKYKMDCKFSHPKEVCKIYFAGGYSCP
jgi:hypothetical protein